ncbi:hypothetical protein LTR36_003185 [Oleoguttula mirabilis]|uniref:C2H2-type domain-containing protein n=1 Tax=Oleoguttula mirabilis TaxID=1507867 RepID=A0AAV9K003_9PEZI|nr:hypothetical protein LTR36_003185 [Oleoguttula mirabilis]
MRTIQQEVELLVIDAYRTLDIHGHDDDTGSVYHTTFRALALRHIFEVLPVRGLPLTSHNDVHTEAPRLAASFLRRYGAAIWRPGEDVSEGSKVSNDLASYFVTLLQANAHAPEDALVSSLAPAAAGRDGRAMSVPPTTRPQWPDVEAYKAECIERKLAEMSIEGVGDPDAEELADPSVDGGSSCEGKGRAGGDSRWRYCRVPISRDGGDEQCEAEFLSALELAEHQLEVHGLDEFPQW